MFFFKYSQILERIGVFLNKSAFEAVMQTGSYIPDFNVKAAMSEDLNSKPFIVSLVKWVGS